MIGLIFLTHLLHFNVVAGRGRADSEGIYCQEIVWHTALPIHLKLVDFNILKSELNTGFTLQVTTQCC